MGKPQKRTGSNLENWVEEGQKMIDEILKRYSILPQEQLFKEFNTSYKGLSIVEIDDKIE